MYRPAVSLTDKVFGPGLSFMEAKCVLSNTLLFLVDHKCARFKDSLSGYIIIREVHC